MSDLSRFRFRLLALCLASALSPAALAASPAVPSGNAALRDTHWVLQAQEGEPLASEPAQPAAHLVLHAASQRLSGFAGCNTLRGRYTQQGTQLALTALASTRKACPQMQQEQRFIELLGAADGYRIEGQVLSLLQGATVRATFKATTVKKSASPKK
ncbi:MAG: META domain-containing protein [Rhizobacter sp.]|nr:META domain-containing protein [Rhizobacter sp.]